MTDKLPVKEHLRNCTLYQSPIKPSPGAEWKRQLIYQYSMHSQLKAVLQEGNHLLIKRFVYIGIPIMCVAAVFAVYLEFLHPEPWFDNIAAILNFSVPPISLKEIFIFSAFVNGLTFLIRKRVFVL